MKTTKQNHAMVIWIICITISCFFIGCSKEKTSLKMDIQKLQSQKIHIPFDSMLYFNGTLPVATESNLHKYKLVVYTDSLSCSSCSLKGLFYWESLIDSLNASMDFVFIISPKKEEIDKVKETLRLERLDCPVYIDTCSTFIRKNPHIPDNSLMHIFLLNDKDSVVLVGNPQSNPKIKELLLNIIKSNNQ